MTIKKIFALTSMITVSGLTYAQMSDVKMYGTLDLGVAYVDNGAKKDSHSFLLSSGISRTSMIGFKGNEDLGDGLRAVFQLEAGFDADTGALKPYQGNPSSATAAAPGGAPVTGLFNRRAIVGLSGRLGTLTLGRDYTPIYWGALDSDSLSLGMYGNLQENAAMSGTGGERFGRASNAVFYVSPVKEGFMGRLMYSAGSESGGGTGAPPSKANRMLAGSGKYTAGGFMLTAVYQQIDLPKVAGTPAAFTGATGLRKDALIGTKYDFGPYSLTAGYFQVHQPTAANTNGNVYWIGGTAQLLGGVLMTNLQHMRQKTIFGTPQTANVFGLAYVYPLSKRTALYSSYGRVNNSPTAAFSLVSSEPTIAPGTVGASIKALAIGLRHSF